jgi:hypothetical protein
VARRGRGQPNVSTLLRAAGVYTVFLGIAEETETGLQMITAVSNTQRGRVVISHQAGHRGAGGMIAGGGSLSYDIITNLGIGQEDSSALTLTIVTPASGKGTAPVLATFAARQRASGLYRRIPNSPIMLSPNATDAAAWMGYGADTETGLPLGVGTKVAAAMGIAVETDTGLAMVAATNTVVLGLAEETETGLPMDSTTGTLLDIAVSTETAGQLLPGTKTVDLGLATEIDTGVNLVTPEVHLGIATETEAGMALEILLVQFFTPPATSSVPAVLPQGTPGQSQAAYALFRHYRARPEGTNVFYLSDGTVTETEPDGESVVWTADERQSHNQNAPYVVRAFYGGHDNYEVNSNEANALIAEGYHVGAEV